MLRTDVRRPEQRMRRTVRAVSDISRTLVHTVEGPRGLLEEVIRAVADHLAAEWTVLALGDGHLPGARPRQLVVDARGDIVGDDAPLPAAVAGELRALRDGVPRPAIDDAGWVRVPMVLRQQVVGGVAGRPRPGVEPEPGDLSILRILANQATVALHTSEQSQAALTLQRHAQAAYDEATARADDLAARTAELEHARHSLLLAEQRELIDAERHRIARDLHDRVAQYVLSAGMAVQVARRDAGALGGPGEPIAAQLAVAAELAGEAVVGLRQAIYALHDDADGRAEGP